MLYRLLRRGALLAPPIRRLVAERDEARDLVIRLAGETRLAESICYAISAAEETDSRDLLLENFTHHLHGIRHAKVLELGTRRSNPDVATIHRDWAAEDADYVLSDFQDGLDVDVVADIHDLTSKFPHDHFDAVIACSVFEHVQRPWLAAKEIASILKPGGQVWIQTHFAFPIHGYPNDYWRFTREALETLFDTEAGFRVVGSDYKFPCHIVSQRVPDTADKEAYLNVSVVAERY